MHRSYANLVFYAAVVGAFISSFTRQKFDGVALIFVVIAFAAYTVGLYFQTLDDAEKQGKYDAYFDYFEKPQAFLCSTCHQLMSSPGCSTSPESKAAYPKGFHTVSGGVSSQK